MPEERLELSCLATHDFESCVSTIPPLRPVLVFYLLRPKMQFCYSKTRRGLAPHMEERVMSKEFPDRHPKLRGNHGLLPQFRQLFKSLEMNSGIIAIIPYESKKDPSYQLPEERWRRSHEVVKPPRNPQEPRVTVRLIYGALSQQVEIAARDLSTLKQFQFC